MLHNHSSKPLGKLYNFAGVTTSSLRMKSKAPTPTLDGACGPGVLLYTWAVQQKRCNRKINLMQGKILCKRGRGKKDVIICGQLKQLTNT